MSSHNSSERIAQRRQDVVATFRQEAAISNDRESPSVSEPNEVRGDTSRSDVRPDRTMTVLTFASEVSSGAHEVHRNPRHDAAIRQEEHPRR